MNPSCFTIVPAASAKPVPVLFSSIRPTLSLPLILIAVRIVAAVIATQKVTVSPSAEIFVIVLVAGTVQTGVHVTVSPTLNFPTSAPLVIVNTLPRSGPDHRILPALIYPVRPEVARGL